MTVICNIQALRLSVGGQEIPFDRLAKMSIETLRELQDNMIPEYNKTVKQIKSYVEIHGKA